MATPAAPTRRRAAVWNLPNIISLSRIALAPFLIWLLLDPSPFAGWVAAVGFVVACLSDLLDGYLARRHGLTTNLGKLLDPLADKILILSALIMLTAMDRAATVPAWIVAVITGREIAVTGLRAIAREEGILVDAESLGKAKTTFQVVAITCLLVHYPYWGIDFFSAGLAFLWIAMGLALWSGISYHVRVGAVLRARDRGEA